MHCLLDTCNTKIFPTDIRVLSRFAISRLFKNSNRRISSSALLSSIRKGKKTVQESHSTIYISCRVEKALISFNLSLTLRRIFSLMFTNRECIRSAYTWCTLRNINIFFIDFDRSNRTYEGFLVKKIRNAWKWMEKRRVNDKTESDVIYIR